VETKLQEKRIVLEKKGVGNPNSMYMQPQQLGGQALPADPYRNDIARSLSFSRASSSEDVIASLRSMNLGDDFWMYSFKVRAFIHYEGNAS
jgi:hypothetical protein